MKKYLKYEWIEMWRTILAICGSSMLFFYYQSTRSIPKTLYAAAALVIVGLIMHIMQTQVRFDASGINIKRRHLNSMQIRWGEFKKYKVIASRPSHLLLIRSEKVPIDLIDVIYLNRKVTREDILKYGFEIKLYELRRGKITEEDFLQYPAYVFSFDYRKTTMLKYWKVFMEVTGIDQVDGLAQL